MKKIFLLLLIANCTSFICFAQTGVIKELSGTVELKHGSSASYVQAKTGDSVNQDTIISTGLKSTALVEIGSAVIAVRPLTRLTLTEIHATSGQETLNMTLQAGRVRVDVNPPAGTKASMAVSSPSATASVRGTSFTFDTRNLSVDHGSVAFKGNRGYTVQVSAGTSSTVSRSGTASAPEYTGNNRTSTPAVSGQDTSSSGTTGSSGEVHGRNPRENDPGTPNPPPGGDPDPPPAPPPPSTPDPPPPPPTGGIDIGITY